MSRNSMKEEDKKSKINLKINENLLNEFDKLLGKEKRSRVIEKLLESYINKKEKS